MTDCCETNPEAVGVKRLQDVSYDPFRLMPRELPPHPRMFVTPDHVARARHLVKTQEWGALALKRLLAAADEPCDLRDTIDAQPHRACGNHNTWGIFGCLSAGVGLGDPQRIHDALYGHESDGHWRYGLIHQLRHDILPDGLHWERAPGYHFYTLMGFVEIAWLCANIGVDILHPVQVSAKDMEPGELKAQFGDRLSFCGGIDTQEVLPHGTREEVQEEVQRRIQELAPGGGYLLAAVHAIQPDVPPENVCTMFEAALVHGHYPITTKTEAPVGGATDK